MPVTQSCLRTSRPHPALALLTLLLAATVVIVVHGDRFSSPLLAQEPNTEAFFEQKIRPVLSQHCYSCHSVEAEQNKKLQARLYLDTADGLLTGGETGPALVKGKSAESLLIKALAYDGLEMPPVGRLPAEVVADFRRWIDAGAIDPRQGSAPTKPKRVIDLAAGRNFWSFQRLHPAVPPAAAIAPAPAPAAAHPIDRFLAAKHQEQGLRPAPAAGKETLIRRAYFDLIGLPPTPEQIDAFLADNSPAAFEKVIDGLLQSSAYGERWARHWLDVARFAESGGYEFDGFRPGAYHYRDWVIKALNADLPYDEFVRMQLVGDLLKPGYEGLSAVGFLMAGPYPGQITAKTVERIRYDQLDDMLMTIGGSMLGLTLGCVRCHDHKYDPIPQADYYALAANLARASHGSVTIDPDPAATERTLAAHAQELENRRIAQRTFGATQLTERLAKWQRDVLPQLNLEPRWQLLDVRSVTSEDTQLNTADGAVVIVDGPRRKDSDKYIVQARTDQRKITGVRLDALTAASLPRKGPGLGGDGSFALGDFKVIAKPLDAASKEQPVTVKLKPIMAAFEEMNQPLKLAVDDNPGTAWRANQDGGKDNAALFEIEGGLAGFDGGTELTVELKFAGPGLGRFRLSITVEPGVPTWAGEVGTQDLGELKALLAHYKNSIPESRRTDAAHWFAAFDQDARMLRQAIEQHSRAKPRPALTDVYTTVAGGQDVFLLRRGEVDNKLGKAEPGFLQVLSSAAPAPEKSTSPAAPNPPATPASPGQSREALARWMTDLEQGAGPLLARVIVNRMWQHHMGEGIVGTPNDFGAQGSLPTHPELLEWLAGELVRGGWKLKPLHKQIMLSAAYQQSNQTTPENLQRDPENRYRWHHRPRRLEAEAIRDALLAVGGNLEASMYGPSVLDNVPRRSVYLRVKRSELIPFMTMFDVPEPTQSVGGRIITTVPTQALTLMNSPFVRQQAERLLSRIKVAPEMPAEQANEQVIEQAYRLAFGRRPSASERELMKSFIAQQMQLTGGAAPPNRQPALLEFCHVVLCLNEFLYID
ncbi:MAG: PSD1 and planctomycete cytochrome C domain-containing protein [Planctomycetota bacterium]